MVALVAASYELVATKTLPLPSTAMDSEKTEEFSRASKRLVHNGTAPWARAETSWRQIVANAATLSKSPAVSKTSHSACRFGLLRLGLAQAQTAALTSCDTPRVFIDVPICESFGTARFKRRSTLTLNSLFILFVWGVFMNYA